MKRATVIAVLSILTLVACVTPRVAVAKGQTSPTGKQETAVKQTTDNSQSNVIPSAQPKTGSRSALIVELDTSPSTLAVLDEMQGVAKQLVNAAPDRSQIGVVGIDSQALKRLFDSHAEANQFIESLSSGGKYTDLDRGVDGGLALLQESGAERAVVVFLTDGKIELPRRFRDKADFVQILKREFAVRPNVKVFVINVGGQQLKGLDTLPPNVSVLSLANWQDVTAEIEKNLAPQIKEQLAEARPQESPGNAVTTSQGKTSNGQTITRALIAGVVLLALGALALLLVRKRRRLAEPALVEIPENAMRREDLEVPSLPQATSEPVALLEFGSLMSGNLNVLPDRHALRRGEKVSIGGSAFACGIYLPGLKQAQTIEITFDGSELNGVRLRPERPGVIDQVKLNRSDAPITFDLRQSDDLQLGDYFMKPVFTDEESLSLIDTSKRTVSGIITSPAPRGQRRVHRGR